MDYLREQHGGRVATLRHRDTDRQLVTEAYTMQRYLRPDLLDDAGADRLRPWAATFGEVTTDIEVAPDGRGSG